MANAKAKKAKKPATTCGITIPDFKEVKVTQKHIDAGQPEEPEFCAIALSVKDVLDSAGIDYDELSAEGNSTTFSFDTEVEVPVHLNGKVVERITRTARVSVDLRLGAKADKFVEAFDNIEYDEETGDSNGYTKNVKPTVFKAKPKVTVELAEAY